MLCQSKGHDISIRTTSLPGLIKSFFLVFPLQRLNAPQARKEQIFQGSSKERDLLALTNILSKGVEGGAEEEEEKEERAHKCNSHPSATVALWERDERLVSSSCSRYQVRLKERFLFSTRRLQRSNQQRLDTHTQRINCKGKC